jgi:hypothetical protein
VDYLVIHDGGSIKKTLEAEVSWEIGNYRQAETERRPKSTTRRLIAKNSM